MNQDDIDKRIERANENQDVHGKCVICGGRFQECPHSMELVNLAIQYYRLRNLK